MVQQVQWLWTVAHKHMASLVSSSQLSTIGVAIAQGSVVAAHAAVQAFVDLCRSASSKLLLQSVCMAMGGDLHCHVYLF